MHIMKERRKRYGMIWELVKDPIWTTHKSVKWKFLEINALLHAWLICLNERQEKER